MIVDDEPGIREGLSLLIDWHAYGFHVLDTAEHGLEALKKLENARYNLVITDIKMPELDGLELIKELKAKSPMIKIIILSGYSDFSYAKAALEHGVKGYLLKPIEEDKLTEAITKIRDELDEELKDKLLMQENVHIARDKFLFDFASGHLSWQDFTENKWKYGVDLKNDTYCITLLEIDRFFYILEKDLKNAQLIKYSIRNIVEEIIQGSKCGLVYEDEQGILGIILDGTKEQLQFNSIRNFLQNILYSILKFVKVSATIGYGKVTNKLITVSKSREYALLALERKVLALESSIISYEDVSVDENRFRELKWEPQKLLVAVEINNSGQIEAEINLFIHEILEKSLSRDLVRVLIYNIVFGLLSTIRTYYGNSSNMSNIREINNLKLNSMDVSQIREWLIASCMHTATCIADLQTKKSENIIAQVKKYIDKNYYEDLTLKIIAGIFFLNPAYLGQLFKNTMGEGFTDYINKIRINEAKQMVLQQDLKINEIVEKVGYNNTDYFYRLFKRYEGISFAEFKEGIKKT